MPFGAVHFGTSEDVHDVAVRKGLVVVEGGAEVPSEHSVVVPFVDTSHRKYGNRQGIWIVRILIEVRVVLSDGSRAHLPICKCLVRIVENIVFLG